MFYKSRIDEVEKMEEYAIRVKNVSKMYKLYDRNKDRLIDAFGLSKTPRYHEHYALHNLNRSQRTDFHATATGNTVLLHNKGFSFLSDSRHKHPPVIDRHHYTGEIHFLP